MNASHEEGRPWYDTMAGIAEALGSLESFNGLISERHAAGYNRHERLNEYYVFGRYGFDACGNCSTISGQAPKDLLPDFPNVLSKAEFWAYLRAHLTETHARGLSEEMKCDIPRHDLVCPVCTKGWTIDNCHDAVAVRETKDMILATSEGKTLRALKADRKAKTDAVYFMQNDILIRNDRFIDLAPEYPDTTESWQKEWVKNEKGWVGAKDGINDDYVIQSGDEGFFNVWTYYHRLCNRLNLAVREETYFRDVFTQAGFVYVVLDRIPNGYCLCDTCAPWFRADTEVGTITIGWRKRVISVSWRGSRPLPRLASPVEVVEITQSEWSIDMHSSDEAVAFLSKTREELLAAA